MITEIITSTGFVNVDYADVKTVMKNRGLAHIGIGVEEGNDRVSKAVDKAINNPLLETSINGATGVLLTISGGYTLSMEDVIGVQEQVYSLVSPDAIIISGHTVKEDLVDMLEVGIIATGFETADSEFMSHSNQYRSEVKDPYMQEDTFDGYGAEQWNQRPSNQWPSQGNQRQGMGDFRNQDAGMIGQRRDPEGSRAQNPDQRQYGRYEEQFTSEDVGAEQFGFEPVTPNQERAQRQEKSRSEEQRERTFDLPDFIKK
jgi:cell division protein FtsZ